mmetsp:Transcript_5784/g.14441  ORF Transcript_5784/g.14441 Transcript_5784/m.14441 type:complete len:90 (+) Transcript_5784:1552-1821(+)
MTGDRVNTRMNVNICHHIEREENVEEIEQTMLWQINIDGLFLAGAFYILSRMMKAQNNSISTDGEKTKTLPPLFWSVNAIYQMNKSMWE